MTHNRAHKLIQAIFISIFLLYTPSSFTIADNITSIDRQSVTIWSQGTRLAADIYKPKNLNNSVQLPGILMIPGWGGSKDNVGKNYAAYIAEQGFIVLTFDFRSWGESDGYLQATEKLPATAELTTSQQNIAHIRNIINPFAMADDVRAALHYLGSEPQVMADTLGVWGTSMGGGLALIAAASDDRVQALVNQMGPVNYRYNLQAIPDHTLRAAEAMVARGQLPAFPGPKSALNPALPGYPDWAALKRFNPLAYTETLTAATLIIDAENETLFETKMNGELLYNRIKENTESRYLVLPGGHYDLYKGSSLNSARKAMLQWFKKHLKKS